MRSPAAERSLRRLVARLAAADPEDVDLVLETLDPVQQREIRALIDALAPDSPLSPAPLQELGRPAERPPEAAADRTHLAGLSDWLAARVVAAEAADPLPDGARMTPAARAALAEAARALPAAPGPPPPERPQRRAGGLLGRWRTAR